MIDTEKVEDIDADPEHDKAETTEDEILEQARERYKLAVNAWEKQLEREKEALRFQVPELQWTDAEKRAREGDGAQPARPRLSVSKLDQPIGLVINQMRNADLGIEVHPISEDADTENAEARQGLYRYIERDSQAELARAWAFDRAVKVGRGAYRILTEYDDEGGEPNDQKIVIRRIKRQEAVLFDPAANEPDFSDGDYAFALQWMTKAEFKRKFPKSKVATSNDIGWESLRHIAPEWVRADDVLVGEYWYKVHRLEKFKVKDEERLRDVWTVYCAKISGWELLEEAYRWPGKWIPLVPVIGKELQSFDEETRYFGMIEPAMGAQKFSNFAITSLAERLALEPKAPWVANAEVIEGYEEQWKQSNIRNFPVLFYNTVVRDGAMLPPPTRATIDSTGMSISLMATQQADQLIQSATAVFSPSLGQEDSKNRSGKSIMALQSQADAGTSHFIQNLADISLTYEARIIMDLMPRIYDRPERILRIVRGDDKKTEPIMVNAPSQMDPRSGRPVPATRSPGPAGPPGGMGGPAVPPGVPGPPQAPPGPKVHNYTLTKGTYGISVTVGKSFQTRLQEGSERMGELMGKRPELFVAMGDLWLQFQDFPGAKEMAKRMAKMREKQMPGIGEGEDGGATVEQLQGQLEGAKGQMEQMGQALQAMNQKIETDMAKQQAQMMKAQLDAQTGAHKAELELVKAREANDTQLRISAADNETKLQIAGLGRQFEALLELLKLEKEGAGIRAAQEHEARMASEDRSFQAARELTAGAAKDGSERRQREHEATMSLLGEPAPTEPEPEAEVE